MRRFLNTSHNWFFWTWSTSSSFSVGVNRWPEYYYTSPELDDTVSVLLS
jgi:hypothetical protein